MGFKRDIYTEGGGVKGVTEFIGRLDDIEESVAGDFGPQDVLYFTDVEVTASEDDYQPDNGTLKSYRKHSTRRNSTSGKAGVVWMDFGDAHGLEPSADAETACEQLLSAFKGHLIRYRKETFEFGKDMSPGLAFVPVELMEDKPKAEARELDPAVRKAVLDTAGGDGATKDMIRRALVKTAALRTATTEAGGVDKILSHLVAEGELGDNGEGYYTLPEPMF